MWGPINLTKYPPPAGKFLPAKELVYRAFELTPFPQVKVVILGQDPYPTKGNANGLAFSVNPHVKSLPGSLRNVIAEYCEDTGFPKPRNGDLSDWAANGVLLLNTILTCPPGKTLGHKDYLPWRHLTYDVIRTLDARTTGKVFLLWGQYAQQYKALINESIHCVLCSPHPSPLARGFRGSRPFSKTNECLKKLGKEPVNWRLS